LKKFISGEWKTKLDQMWAGRHSFHYLRPSVESDQQKLEGTARKNLNLLNELEQAFLSGWATRIERRLGIGKCVGNGRFPKSVASTSLSTVAIPAQEPVRLVARGRCRSTVAPSGLWSPKNRAVLVGDLRCDLKTLFRPRVKIAQGKLG
jgi:hypothetical protein